MFLGDGVLSTRLRVLFFTRIGHSLGGANEIYD